MDDHEAAALRKKIEDQLHGELDKYDIDQMYVDSVIFGRTDDIEKYRKE